MRRATIVLDTSSILHNHGFVQQLADEANHHNVEILIPQQVILELDKIKDRQGMSQVGKEARTAINWINLVLMNQNVEDPVLRGQRRSEILSPELTGDDAILDCALYNHKLLGNITLLLTEDNNLANRAMIDGLETLVAKNGVNVKQVYDAIANRCMSLMDLDNDSDSSAILEEPLNTSISTRVGKSVESSAQTPAVSMDSTLSPNNNWNLNTVAENSSSNDFGEHGKPVEFEELNGSDNVQGSKGLNGSVWSTRRGNIPEKSRNLDETKRNPPEAIRAQNLETFVMVNLRHLTDWHIHQHFDDDELNMLGYRKPISSLDIAYALKRFSFSFDIHLPVGLVPSFMEVVRKGKIDKKTVSLHVNLLLRLAFNDVEYQKLLRKYDGNAMTDTEDVVGNAQVTELNAVK